ncbi:hypothetical protein ACFQZ2_01800 [Streptomonospora algeriensis]|uniref:Uncharacterized protein n=1 Tax=Streptomonospora algeriensis TaxID=995084 RepID=A0ABW3BES2_9ACTN
MNPWAPPAETTPPPADDGLDDLRQALNAPIRALIAARPDLGHPAPTDGRAHDLAGV